MDRGLTTPIWRYSKTPSLANRAPCSFVWMFNHTQFLFSGNIAAFQDSNAPSTFGRVTTAYQGRVVQLGTKIYF